MMVVLSDNYLIYEMSYDDLEFFNKTRNESSEFLHDSNNYSLSECVDWFQNSHPLYYIVSYGKDKIGYFRVSDMRGDSACIGMDIKKDFRGMGHAQQAYPLFMEYLRGEYGVNYFWLRVLKSNPRALHVYEKLGFKIVEETDKDIKMELK